MAEKGNCPYLYRQPGKDTAHCKIQSDRGSKWDFCKHQYFCLGTKRYEANKDAANCTLKGGIG